MSGFMNLLISTLHIAACVALIVSILLQSGKGGGLAGAFGAGSSQTLFGGRGAATFLSRAATVLAVVFFTTSLTLGLSASRRASPTARSLIQEEARKRAGEQPTVPAPPGGGTAPAPIQTPPVQPAPGQPSPGTTQGSQTPPGGSGTQ